MFFYYLYHYKQGPITGTGRGRGDARPWMGFKLSIMAQETNSPEQQGQVAGTQTPFGLRHHFASSGRAVGQVLGEARAREENSSHQYLEGLQEGLLLFAHCLRCGERHPTP